MPNIDDEFEDETALELTIHERLYERLSALRQTHAAATVGPSNQAGLERVRELALWSGVIDGFAEMRSRELTLLARVGALEAQTVMLEARTPEGHARLFLGPIPGPEAAAAWLSLHKTPPAVAPTQPATWLGSLGPVDDASPAEAIAETVQPTDALPPDAAATVDAAPALLDAQPIDAADETLAIPGA